MSTTPTICPLCHGSGWKPVRVDGIERVTRCDCQLKSRPERLLKQARIPKRYEHCELTEFFTDHDGAHPAVGRALLSAKAFVAEYPVEKTGLLLTGPIGVGKTHIAVGTMQELMRNKAIGCLFYDYRELLKEIQNSYNASVQATELEVLRPVFETEVLVLDELGAVKPSEWVWDTVSLILNTRYNDNRTTIITTNYDDKLAGSDGGVQGAARKETLGDRIGDRMLSRLHEMCRTLRLDGSDFREKYRNASFR